MKKLLIQGAAFLGAFAIIGGVTYLSMVPSLNSIKSSRQVIVEIKSEGGRCLNDATVGGVTCERIEKIYLNGSYSAGSSLTNEQLQNLNKYIKQSDLTNTLKANPEGYCPSYADGLDVSFAFPEKYGNTFFKLCKIITPEQDPLLGYTMKLTNSN